MKHEWVVKTEPTDDGSVGSQAECTSCSWVGPLRRLPVVGEVQQTQEVAQEDGREHAAEVDAPGG
jgi:hypothetical protein